MLNGCCSHIASHRIDAVTAIASAVVGVPVIVGVLAFVACPMAGTSSSSFPARIAASAARVASVSITARLRRFILRRAAHSRPRPLDRSIDRRCR